MAPAARGHRRPGPRKWRQAWAVAADLADPDGPDRLFAAADTQLDRLDVLVNNAAVAARVALDELAGRVRRVVSIIR